MQRRAIRAGNWPGPREQTPSRTDQAIGHHRALRAHIASVRARDVRVVPHALCFSGAAGFAVYQRLNKGTLDRAVQASRLSAREAAAWWAGLEQAAEAETFFSAVLGFIAAGSKA